MQISMDYALRKKLNDLARKMTDDCWFFALRAYADLRDQMLDMERELVRTALVKGVSWHDIASWMNRSVQTVHAKWAKELGHLSHHTYDGGGWAINVRRYRERERMEREREEGLG